MSDDPQALPAARPIVTLTLNPALDLAATVERIEPWRKMRCSEGIMDPGGGGVNVARAAQQLGAAATAVVALGGHVGSLVADALARSGVPMRRVRVKGVTRQNFSVTERASGDQYRFVHPGPSMSAAEWRRCLETTVELAPTAACVVASSSMPPGVPADAFTALAERIEPFGIPLIVDTSGAALAAAITAPLTLVKPSANELRTITGTQLATVEQYERAARQLLRDGRCKVIVVSLGPDGALFVPRDSSSFVARPPAVRAVSSIGAGDSMVAGLAIALTRGASLQDAARLGIAAGTAAVLAEGTTLCRRADVDRLVPLVTIAPLRP